jgi:hypothetical protein
MGSGMDSNYHSGGVTDMSLGMLPGPEPMRVHRLLLVCVLGLSLVACERGQDPAGFVNEPLPTRATPVATATGTPAAEVTPPAPPPEPPATSGAPSANCAGGWVTPEAGTTDFTDPIGVIRRTAPFDGPYEVVDMRMFVGPESPPSDKGYISEIRRWYVKLYAAEESAYQGRFLVEERRFGKGVAAVAPYDTAGYASPDWVGFQWADEPAEAYDGLPGRWQGLPYDFVRGGAGLTIPGLPAEVDGCLDGT